MIKGQLSISSIADEEEIAGTVYEPCSAVDMMTSLADISLWLPPIANYFCVSTSRDIEMNIQF